MSPTPWWARLGPRTLAAATATMAVLLVGLAVLQYRWVGQVSQAERQRLKRGLETAADRIADDLDREVFRAFVALHPQRDRDEPLAERLADGWERWRATALEPAMIAAVYVFDPEASGPPGGTALRKLDPQSRRLEATDWPPQLAALADWVGGVEAGRRPAAAGRVPVPWGPALASAPALLLPARLPQRGRQAAEAAMTEPRSVLVLLDRAVIGSTVLPRLVGLHLGSETGETEVWVIDRSRRGETVFTTVPAPAPTRRPDSGIAVRPVLGLRFFPELRAQGFQHFFDDPEARWQLDAAQRPGVPWTEAPWRESRGQDVRRPGAPQSRRAGPGAGRPDPSSFARGRYPALAEQAPWALILARSEGSLEAAVSRLRRRNLGLGLAAVGLLGATAGLLLASARQVQRLARRELELVAGITHELRTPLAAIGSAADNLADGVVDSPAQIRRYGTLIRGETHRLGALVAQVLDFAGTAAMRGRPRPLEPVDVGSVVERVLADHRWSIEEKGFAIELRCEAGAPRAMADPDTLRRAIDNVVGNALKYGEAGHWLSVEVGQATASAGRGPGSGGGPRVAVRVRDRGPGIPRAERRRIFEPFYRGESSVADHLHGTGLGLAVSRTVLESFGGTIEIEDSEPGRGTTFLLTVPAAPLAVGAPDQNRQRAAETRATEGSPDGAEATGRLPTSKQE